MSEKKEKVEEIIKNTDKAELLGYTERSDKMTKEVKGIVCIIPRYYLK